jgi:hypothetical protein
VEESPRRRADSAAAAQEEARARQRRYVAQLGARADLQVRAADDMRR